MSENTLTCRICLAESNKSSSIFDRNDSSKYSDLIQEYLGLDVVKNDNLPTGICVECSSELAIAVQFMSKYRISNEKLKDALDLNIPFYRLLSNYIKKEDDEENLPLSIVSASIKIEKGEPSDFENSSDNVFYTDNHSVQEKFKPETKAHFTVLKSKEHGLKKDMVQCLTCGLLVQNKSAFLIHNRKHTGEKPCQCPHCEKSFTQMGTLTDHIKRHHLKDVQFIQAEALTERIRKKHLKDEFGFEKRYVCDTCGKQFLKKNYLTVHTRVHTMEKPYQCSYCPKGFRRCIDFIQHKRIHTGERPYSCHVCGKTFVAHTPLKRHLTVHSDERKYKCTICNTAVKSSDSLKKHILVMHSSEKRNVCSVCGSAFAMKYNLKAHMRARHSERSGFCELCKKSFSNLPKHTTTHLVEKPYGCHMCSKRFFREKGLSAHMAKHENENATFPCSFEDCNSAFSKQCKLDFHTLKYHSDHTPHVCQYCSKGFYRLPDLRRHLKSNHDRLTEPILPDSFPC